MNGWLLGGAALLGAAVAAWWLFRPETGKEFSQRVAEEPRLQTMLIQSAGPILLSPVHPGPTIAARN